MSKQNEFDFSIDRLGEAKLNSPIRMSGTIGDGVADYVKDTDQILYSIDAETVDGEVRPVHTDAIELAGPREKIYFNPSHVHAAICTCGGLCPGLNNVIRAVVRCFWYRYGVRRISGIQYGYECTDIEVDITEIGYNELTSTPMAFTTCAAMGFDRICQEAGAIMMEPIMKIQATAPSEYIGDVISSLTSRGGIVISMESKSSSDTVIAEAPLAKMFGYTTVLRSATQGRGSFSMEFDHYSEKAN